MSDVTKLGELLDSTAQRDAVHIAVAPVVAAEDLVPGQHVGFVQAGNSETVGPIADGRRGFQNKAAIGIVDPFLTIRVRKGERFWLFLYPNTITSLRHQWTHPAFVAVTAPAQASESEAWMSRFAESIGLSYGTLMRALGDYIERGAWYCFSDETPEEVWSDTETMWRHYEALTNTKVPDHETAPFRCAC